MRMPGMSASLSGGKGALIRAIKQVDLRRAALFETFSAAPLEPEEAEKPTIESVEDIPGAPKRRKTFRHAVVDLTREAALPLTDDDDDNDDEDFDPSGSRPTKSPRTTGKLTGARVARGTRPGPIRRSGLKRKVALKEHEKTLLEQNRQLNIEVYLFNNDKHANGNKSPWDFLFITQRPVHATRSHSEFCKAVVTKCLEQGTIQDEPGNAHKAELVILNTQINRWTMPYVKEFDDFLKDWYENEDNWVEPKTRVKVMMAPSKLWLKQQQTRKKTIPTQEACSVVEA
jgi:hypothetical protein